MSLETLLDQYRSRGIEKAGELLLHFSDALAFIEDCRQAGYVILRMNFWSQAAHGISQTAHSANAAVAILQKQYPGEDWVSFIVEDEPVKD